MSIRLLGLVVVGLAGLVRIVLSLSGLEDRLVVLLTLFESFLEKVGVWKGIGLATWNRTTYYRGRKGSKSKSTVWTYFQCWQIEWPE